MSNVNLYIDGILLAYMAFMLGILSPGPNVLNVISASISKGRRAGVSLALGVAFGSFTWASITALGLSALLLQYSNLLMLIKILGAAYLVWLAYKAFKNARMQTQGKFEVNEAPNVVGVKLFLQGYIVQMTNPKAALTWIAIISLGIGENSPMWVVMSIIIGTSILSIIGHLVYAFAFSSEIVVRNYLKAKSKIDFVLGVFYLGAAFKLLHSVKNN